MKKHSNTNTTINTIYGINSSISVLNSDSCIVRNIFIAKNSKSHKNNNIKNIIKKRNLFDKVSIVDISRIDKNKKNIRSQGIMIDFLFLGLKYDLDTFLDDKLDNGDISNISNISNYDITKSSLLNDNMNENRINNYNKDEIVTL